MTLPAAYLGIDLAYDHVPYMLIKCRSHERLMKPFCVYHDRLFLCVHQSDDLTTMLVKETPAVYTLLADYD